MIDRERKVHIAKKVTWHLEIFMTGQRRGKDVGGRERED